MADVVVGKDKCGEQRLVSLPLSRIRVIMKSSPEVSSINQEALVLTAKATVRRAARGGVEERGTAVGAARNVAPRPAHRALRAAVPTPGPCSAASFLLRVASRCSRIARALRPAPRCSSCPPSRARPPALSAPALLRAPGPPRLPLPPSFARPAARSFRSRPPSRPRRHARPVPAVPRAGEVWAAAHR